MKPENNPGSIHVFRVNQATTRSKSTVSKKTSSSPTTATQAVGKPITTKNSRTRMSAETKRLICEDHIENPKCTQEVLAGKYGCKRTTIAKIIKSKDRWLSIDIEAAVAKRFRQRNSRYPLVENALVSWLQKEHSDTAIITDKMIRSQAHRFAQTFYADGFAEFKASSSWVSKFKQNYMQQKSYNSSQASGLRSTTPDTFSSPSGSHTPKSINHSLPTTNSNTSVEDMNPMASNTSIENTVIEASLSRAMVVASSSFVLSTAATNSEPTGSSTNLSQNDADHNINTLDNNSDRIHLTLSVVKTLSGREDMEHETHSHLEKEAAYDTLVDDMHQDDYNDRFDMDDCNSFILGPPCFDNSAGTSSPALANNNQAVKKKTQEQTTLEEENTNSLQPATILQQPIPAETDTAGPATATANIIDTISQQHETTKLSAKQHLEAALAFYTSQNESNASMSANMIKLILQNDF